MNGGPIQDLNNMILVGNGLVLGEATTIDDARQIAGYGTINGENHALSTDACALIFGGARVRSLT
jgi:hypothetical protein